MDVLCTSTGKVFYQIDSQIAALRIEALPSVFENAEKPKLAPTPLEAEWSFGTNNWGDFHICLRTPCLEYIRYNGPAEHAATAFPGYTVPAQILEEYTRRSRPAPSSA